VSELTVRFSVIPSAAEESTRSDSVLDARHCGIPFEQRCSGILAVQTGLALIAIFATLRGDSSAALGMTEKGVFTNSLTNSEAEYYSGSVFTHVLADTIDCLLALRQ
jgi:hypothetical protein